MARTHPPVWRITRLRLRNWKNFRDVDVELQPRSFLVGPNASGKSNLLDALRFLRDVASPTGGLATALKARGGLAAVRSLAARNPSEVEIDVEAREEGPGGAVTAWRYRLVLGKAEPTRERRHPPPARIRCEVVERNGEVLLARPFAGEEKDPELLGQTHLEQAATNQRFRALRDFLGSIAYVDPVPSFVRMGLRTEEDPWAELGADLLHRIAASHHKSREARLRRIERVLSKVVPRFEGLEFDEVGDDGEPHLWARYRNWRPQPAARSEQHWSDGTLRLLTVLWHVLEPGGPLLLEEPEKSLHPAVVRQMAPLLSSLRGKRGRQVVLTTHSPELLADEGIAPEEVLLMLVEGETTRVLTADREEAVRLLVEGGVPVSEAVLPHVEPPDSHELLGLEATSG